MKQYILMDGAMIHHDLSASKWFVSPGALFAALMPRREAHLAGPILISDQCARQDANKGEILRLMGCFPCRLHIAFIDSPLGLEELAAHLRHFVYFGDDTGQAYGLRIADGRVMAYLPQALTVQQWNAMTAPIESWRIHNRQGKTQALALNDTRRQCTQPAQPLRLNDEQIERLIQEGEPDALLSNLNRHAEAIGAKSMQWHHDIASYCVKVWRWHQQLHNPGHQNRDVLHAFANRVFASRAAWLNDQARVRQEIHAAAARVQQQLEPMMPGGPTGAAEEGKVT